MVFSKCESKKKYKLIQNGGNKSKINFIILNTPDPKTSKNEQIKEHTLELKKFGNVINYYFKFGSSDNNFKLDDLTFENVAKDMKKSFEDYDKIFLICIEEASPFGLFFVDKFPENIISIICFPFRLYTKESLDRYIWKYKEKNGWYKYISKKYDLTKYLLEINDDNLQELLNNKENEEEKMILYSIMTYNIRKQFDKIPDVFKISTCLFTRLDLSAKSTIEKNFERKAISDMKEIMSENDALLASMMWNFARVQYDDDLLEKNKNNSNLRIQYIIADNEYANVNLDLLDKIKALICDF